jgi:hypothetical protein
VADIGNFVSVPRGGNAFHTAKQRHQIRNLNVFERMHGIFDLAARPLVGAAGCEPTWIKIVVKSGSTVGGCEPRKSLTVSPLH